MYPFHYHRTHSIELAKEKILIDEDAKFLAGGMTLLPAMKHRLASPSHLIDIGNIDQLRGITLENSALMIGAVTKHNEVAHSSVVRERINGLSQLAKVIGDPQVRSRGTLGGSLANNDPAADYPAAALALNAQIITDQRTILAKDFFQGLYTTALQPGELIQRVGFQIPEKSTYVKLKQTASGYALVGVFIAKYGPKSFQIAVTGVGDGVFRWTAAELALANDQAIPVLEHDNLIEDLHASGRYRSHMTRVLLEQALSQLI